MKSRDIRRLIGSGFVAIAMCACGWATTTPERSSEPSLAATPQPSSSAGPARTAAPAATSKTYRRLEFKDAGFAIVVPSWWQISSVDSETVTLGSRWGLGPTWDPTYTLVISITSARTSFDVALATALTGREDSTATPLEIGAGRSVFLPSTSLNPPPIVLIEQGERVFAFAVRDLNTPGAGGTELRAIAATFEPLDVPAPSPTVAPPAPLGLYQTHTDPSGFEIAYGHRFSDDEITDVQPGFGYVTVVGRCSFDFCPLSAVISGAILGDGPVVAFDPIRRVSGRTLDELEAAWVGLFGPLTRTPRNITVDGEIGRLLQSGSGASPTPTGGSETAIAILVIHGDHAYAFVARPFLNYGSNAEFLNTIVANFTFVEPS